MGCTTSTDGGEPGSSKRNQIIGANPDPLKELSKKDRDRIRIVLEYWYDDREWTLERHHDVVFKLQLI